MATLRFLDFFRCSWPELTRERPQLLEVAEVLESFVSNGKTGDVLNVSMPTRFGKSLLATSFSVWLLLMNPDKRILRASYAADLAESFSLQVKNQYIKFCEMLGETPKITGTRSRWRIDEQQECAHIGVGIGGGVTGFGCDIAIVDDTAKSMLEAMSAAYGRQLETFKDSVLLGRLENERKIINVGTRWTVNDWFSYWPDAKEVVLPAMVDGRSVCEAWKTTSELMLERERVTDDVWEAQYLQRPTATGKVRMFEGWTPGIVSAVPDGKHILVCDPSTEYGKDWFVVGDYVRVRGLVYLCGMFAKKRATVDEVAAWVKSRSYDVMYIETNGAGANIADRLRRDGVRGVVGFSTNKDKYSRAWLQMENIKNYLRVAFSGDEVGELLRQADEFPAGEHDDLIDNVVMAFERFRI